MTRRRAVLAAVLAALWLAGPAAAGPPTDQVKRYTDHVVRILRNPSLQAPEKRAEIRKVAEEVFDVAEAAKRALGPHWRTLSPAQRDEFVRLFADLLDRTYASKIDHYGGEEVVYTGEVIDGDYAVVKARIGWKGREVPVEARLLKQGSRWLVYDILVENVSLVSNYRAQFNRIIRTESFAELLRRLREQQQEGLRSS